MKVYEASAPGRCGIVGNPSDIYGGVVVSCSIPSRAYCRLTVGRSAPAPEDPRLWDAALRRFPLENASVEWQTDIPRSSGLSGSTALLAATLACLLHAHGREDVLEDTIAFAELVRDVERHDAGIMCGYQDAYMIVHGGLREMNFEGKHPTRSGPPATVGSIDSDLPFLLITTGVERLSGSVHAPMSQRWLEGEREVVAGIKRIAEFGVEGASALRRQDWASLAKAMSENHRIVASLGGSGEPVEQLIEACLSNGALAAKLAGAGHGGTVIALVEDPADLRHRLESLGYSRFLEPRIGPGIQYG